MSEDRYEEIMRAAREHAPHDTARASIGLETRVAARVRGEGRAAPAFGDDLLRWIWRSTIGLAPLVALLVVWLCVWSGFSVEPFSYDAVGDLAALLPEGLE